jgi:hypothetical protein
MFGYALVALGLEMIVWFVPNLIGNAVSVALVGLCLGEFRTLTCVESDLSMPRFRRTHVPYHAFRSESVDPARIGRRSTMLDRKVSSTRSAITRNTRSSRFALPRPLVWVKWEAPSFLSPPVPSPPPMESRCYNL